MAESETARGARGGVPGDRLVRCGSRYPWVQKEMSIGGVAARVVKYCLAGNLDPLEMFGELPGELRSLTFTAQGRKIQSQA